MKRGSKIRQRSAGEIPESCVKLAYDRTYGMVAHYGQFIHIITLDQLAASCWLQGVEDAFQAEQRALEMAQLAPSYEI